MSVAVRRAIYGKLAGDSTLTAMLWPTPPTGFNKSIYHEDAPQGAGFPYVIFQKQSGTPTYASKGSASIPLNDELWTIKAVDKSGSADVADNIASRLDALLTDGPITISGATQLFLRRESDVEYPEPRDGVLYRHAGAMFRLIYTT